MDKEKEEQRLVRNEFLYYDMSSGKFDFPIIKKQNIDLNDISLISYVDTKRGDEENKNKIVHFFTYDWLFEKVYSDPENEAEKLGGYKALLSPDFSIFTNMPKALQIASIFKNRWCGAYWQSKGFTVIPTVSWGDKSSFSFCFDGIEKGSIVAVSTYYRENCEEEFLLGYNKMLEVIKPEAVLCYDEPFEGMSGRIIELLPTTYEWTKNLNKKDLAQFKWEKRHRNVSGLAASDFKFFDYDDPYVKNVVTVCSICGKLAVTDKYGNGECPNCGWKFGKDEEELAKKQGISYPMLVTPDLAREQYKRGEKLKASFENFLNGLDFYGEMLFKYRKKSYCVFLYDDSSVELSADDGFYQKYNSIEEFAAKANIGGALLSDIWNDVEDPSFMFCG